MKESEKKLERTLNQEVKKLGGWSLKLLSTFVRGLPDRLILMPEGRVYFVEVKSEGKKPTTLQVLVHTRLEDLGFKVYVIDTTIKLNEFLKDIKK